MCPASETLILVFLIGLISGLFYALPGFSAKYVSELTPEGKNKFFLAKVCYI
jgi:hypothetical protein